MNQIALINTLSAKDVLRVGLQERVDEEVMLLAMLVMLDMRSGGIRETSFTILRLLYVIFVFEFFSQLLSPLLAKVRYRHQGLWCVT